MRRKDGISNLKQLFISLQSSPNINILSYEQSWFNPHLFPFNIFPMDMYNYEIISFCRDMRKPVSFGSDVNSRHL